MSRTQSKKDQIKALAESDLYYFIKLIHPDRVLGHIHQDVIRWWYREEAKTHQLLLLPRDHQKSALLAYRVAWELTRDPSLRILYISSTSNLAEKQLKFIKDILTSRIYRYYWPEMVNEKEGDREKWTEREISVDHPLRKARNVRDPSIFTAGLTTNIVGMHCDIAALDDVVVDDTAYSEEGRNKVRSQVSYLASIAGTDSRMWAVGTRYHPKDLYQDFMEMEVEIFDEDGNKAEDKSYYLWEKFEREVEDQGDGTGQYLWPRSLGQDGRWFGFNQNILAQKRAQYQDITKFRAQYYNNPNDLSTATINPGMFQYYDRSHITNKDGSWYFKDRKLNVYASIDFAYSLGKKSDYTAIVVVGVDQDYNYLILDIDRFKTNQISDYYDHIFRMYIKWNFKKLRAEVTAAQSAIVEELKNNYIKRSGISLAIDEHRPTRHDGAKEERMEAILQPKYANRQMWHYRGGGCEILEEELVYQRPAHDDVKDSLASCLEICLAPNQLGFMQTHKKGISSKFANKRFGGIN